jgi:L-lactate utilization protein LutB
MLSVFVLDFKNHNLNLIKFSSFFVHFSKSGVTDYYAQDDQHALHIARRIVKNVNYQKNPGVR